MHESPTARFWEVDFLRGVAIIMMVLYHFVFDLNYFGIRSVEVHSGFWFYFARVTASLFLLLVGVSLVLSHYRAEKQGQSAKFRLRILKRSIWIFCLALGITLVTYLFIGNGFIIFGVLHLIAVSLLLALPFLRLHWLNIVFGLLFLLSGLFIQSINVDYPWLLWLGLTPSGFYSLDYFPIVPWFGVVLIGVAVGDLFYRDYCRKIPLPDLGDYSFVRSLAFLGQNSLALYLVHQPMLIAIFYLCGISSVMESIA
jgi:uncharacterized membrane protein